MNATSAQSDRVRPDPQVKDGEPEALRLPNGRFVLRQKFTNGNVQDTQVFPSDYPDAKPAPA